MCTFSSLLEPSEEDDSLSLYSTQVHVGLEENSTAPLKTSEKLKRKKLKLHHLDTISLSKKISPEKKDDNTAKETSQIVIDNTIIYEDEDDNKRKRFSKF